MTKPEIEAAETRLAKARRMVHDLCQPKGTAGAREWIMRIPADEDNDPDLVIGAALSDLAKLLREAKGREEN
jgi:hypothetical protein